MTVKKKKITFESLGRTRQATLLTTLKNGLQQAMKQYLKNNLLSISIDSFGAELHSVINNITGHQYLWQGDKTFWGRRSPILFPIVGKVWKGQYRLDQQEYRLGQHGFARDREFNILDCDDESEAWFFLEADEDSLKVYPRQFRLEIGYRLQDERITVMWRVHNLDNKPMPFQIGAHPAFNYPDFNATDTMHAYLDFSVDCLSSQMLTSDGAVTDGIYPVDIDNDGLMPVTADTFRYNTLILDDRHIHRVSMLDKEHRPYLSLLFSSPLLGVWSPDAKAPFICLEPWWGRCDRENYNDIFENREYMNILEPGHIFEASYTIIIENI